jgi:hypothetical protein
MSAYVNRVSRASAPREGENAVLFPNDLPNKATHFVGKAAAAIFFDEKKNVSIWYFLYILGGDQNVAESIR